MCIATNGGKVINTIAMPFTTGIYNKHFNTLTVESVLKIFKGACPSYVVED